MKRERAMAAEVSVDDEAPLLAALAHAGRLRRS
jgi:hypothetical protein